MALQHLRSSTANKRPNPTAMATGQVALNTATTSPGVFFKDANDNLIKVGPVHVGTTAPNATPASGGQAGNSVGEQWLDTSGANPVFKIWDGSNWISEAGEFVNASGDTMTGALVMANQQQVRFREASANGTNFIALQAPASVASDKTITLPDVAGTVVTTGDTGTVTSTMLLDGTIVNADINASAAIADTKLATIATAGKVSNSATTATDANTASAIVARGASGGFSAGTVTLNPTAGDGSRALQFNENYAIFADNTGAGTASNRLWIDTPDEGEIVLGPRAGANKLHDIRLRARHVNISPSGDLDTTATLSVRPENSDTIATIFRLRQFNAAVTDQATFEMRADAAQNLIFYRSAGTSAGGHVFETGATERLRITPGGNIGIGISNPSFQLVVSKTGAEGFEFSPGFAANKNVSLHYNRSTATYIDHQVLAENHIFSRNNPNTESARIDSSGRLLVGTSTGLTVFNYRQSGGNLGALQVVTVGAGANTPTLASFAAATYAQQLSFAKSRGTTVGDYTIVQDGDNLGSIFFFGADGSDILTAGAAISAQVDGAPAADVMPGRLIFSTTAAAGGNPAERMRIDSSGRVGIGTSSPTSALDIGNAVGTAGDANKIALFSSLGAPIYGFGVSSAQLDYVTGGSHVFYSRATGVSTERMRISSSGAVTIPGSLAVTGTITGPTEPRSEASTALATTLFAKSLFGAAGTAGTLDWNHVSNTTPGVGTTLLLGSATNGPGGGYFHPLNFEYVSKNGTGNLTQFAVGYNSLEMYQRYRFSGTWTSWVRLLNSGNFDSFAMPLSGGTLLAAPGAVATPTISFSTDVDTGFYSSGSNSIGVATGGTLAAIFDSSGNLRLYNTAGTFYHNFSGQPTVNRTITLPDASVTLVGGTMVPTSGATMTGALVGAAGTVAAPGIAVGNSADGIFRPATSNLAFGTAGVEHMRLNSAGVLLHGNTVSRSVVSTAQVQIETTAGYALSLTNNSASATGPLLCFGKSRGTVVGTTTAVVNNDILGYIRFAGADGTDLNTWAAEIRGEVDGTVGSSIMPGRLTFFTTAAGAGNPTQRMIINAAGNVGIGTTAPEERLHVLGQLRVSSSTANAIAKNGVISTTHYTIAEEPFNVITATSGVTTNSLRLGGGLSVHNAATSVEFWTGATSTTLSGTEVARFTGDNYLRFAASTGGVQFGGDTAAANALNDYEEGAWTLQFYDAVSGGNLSSTSFTAQYIKIGNVVHCWSFGTNISTAGLTAGNVLFFTLPFQSANATGLRGIGSVNFDNVTFATDYVNPQVGSGASRGSFIKTTNGAADANLIVSNLSSGVSDYAMSFTYRAVN
jgi:hypothetical protein